MRFLLQNKLAVVFSQARGGHEDELQSLLKSYSLN
jgi:hypothetical protein